MMGVVTPLNNYLIRVNYRNFNYPVELITKPIACKQRCGRCASAFDDQAPSARLVPLPQKLQFQKAEVMLQLECECGDCAQE